MIIDNFYQLIVSPLKEETIQLEGFGGTSPTPLGSYNENIQIAKTLFRTKIYVVESAHMSIPVIFVRDVIAQGKSDQGDQNGISPEKTRPYPLIT